MTTIFHSSTPRPECGAGSAGTSGDGDGLRKNSVGEARGWGKRRGPGVRVGPIVGRRRQNLQLNGTQLSGS